MTKGDLIVSNVYSKDIERKKEIEYKKLLKEEKDDALKDLMHTCPFCLDNNFTTNRQLAGHKGWCEKNPKANNRRLMAEARWKEKMGQPQKVEEPTLSELFGDIEKYKLTPEQVFDFIHKFKK